ncbi:hypothetical protein VF14_18505 [Nostoc linckia z18]|uniref:Uncharacterized protein n=1 Tax=Nostoc linckia z7 TaxID=1628745 RepID=A0ABX4KI71_NOSLI|nr:hypothetical protein VF04_36590 [Nostoc linckia z7]PHK09350.1 hypothetical protein VF09_16170 [Nostoc linckia z9]PHK33105.1 hypothetical protein VF14_18505 [Nostoc linckia z18]
MREVAGVAAAIIPLGDGAAGQREAGSRHRIEPQFQIRAQHGRVPIDGQRQGFRREESGDDFTAHDADVRLQQVADIVLRAAVFVVQDGAGLHRGGHREPRDRAAGDGGAGDGDGRCAVCRERLKTGDARVCRQPLQGRAVAVHVPGDIDSAAVCLRRGCRGLRAFHRQRIGYGV